MPLRPLHAPSGPLARSRWAFDTLLNNPAEVPLTWIQATASPPAIRSYWAFGALQAGFSHASEGSSGVTPYADPNYPLATSPPPCTIPLWLLLPSELARLWIQLLGTAAKSPASRIPVKVTVRFMSTNNDNNKNNHNKIKK